MARCGTAAIGAAAIGWAVMAIGTYRGEAALSDPSHHIMLADRYSEPQLTELKSEVDAAADRSLRPSALNDIAIIRLRLAEAALASGKPEIAGPRLNELDAAVEAALSASPANGLLWLMDYWIQGERTGAPERGIGLLRMSYAEAPNEAWIATRRNALALNIFPSLPGDLADQVISEFSRLVSSGLYGEAAAILAGPGAAYRDRLLAPLAQVDEGDRRRFARVLDAQNLDGALVPGLGERPF